MCHLPVAVDVEFGGRNFLLVGKVCNTGFYSGEAVPHRYIFQCLVWRGQQEGDKDCYECHNPSSQYQQFPGRYPPDEHHQVDRSEEQHSRRVVFRQDKATDNAGNNHDALKGFRTCTVFILPFREDKGGNDDNGHLRYFRRLELNAHEGHPAGCAVYAVAGNESHQHHKSQQSDGYRKQEYREHLKPFIGDVVYQYYNDGAYHQEDAVLRNRSPMVATLVGQRTGSTEYLCDGDEAKEKENNPNHFIAFEYAL